jgi:hypothetical protein
MRGSIMSQYSTESSDALQPLSDAELDELLAAIKAEQARRAAATPVEEVSPAQRAWEIATGARTDASDEGHRILGAQNDYNSRGNGSTTARRVLRNGSWEWVSAPASRGRYLASDRKDTQYGDVYEGEIVAGYTLGSSRPTPDAFWLVIDAEKPLVLLGYQKIKTGYRLTRKKTGETIDVSDPTWRS